MYQSDVTRPLQLQQSVAAGSYTSQQLEQRGQQVEPLGGVRAKRDAAASVQQRLLTDLELREQTVRRLQGELEEKNAFIDDLKSALRSQEGVFQEMLKATEQLRLVEGVKNQMEKQVVLLRAEVKHMEDRIKQQETEHSGELATKLAELHEAHTKEVEAVQEAFAQYDADMTEYVENLRKDRDREVHKWSEQERLLQKQIESQKREIAELTNALASRGGSPSLGKAATRNDKTLKSRVLLSPSQQKGGKARQVCPSASELELQMLSLEEEHERSRLYAKLRQYARSQRRTPNRVPFDGKDDN
ncbi:hypothetical protein DQ04_00161000, partial [Trypanosoma grayi]|uniref:hypothetical protein n=1 Tax=Trypanosoma grayi TaxID=71804 RepID=UPI0004F491C9